MKLVFIKLFNMKKDNKDLNHYFETTRKQAPVISAEEIAGIIQQGVADPVSPASKSASFWVLPKLTFLSTGAAASHAVANAFISIGIAASISVGVAASLAVKEIGPEKLLLLGSTIIRSNTIVVQDVQVYPNPTSEWLNLQMGFMERVDVRISLKSLKGKPVKIFQNFRPISELYAFYVADIAPGIYLLVVEPQVGKPYTKQVIIK